jgi:hypothetical protein
VSKDVRDDLFGLVKVFVEAGVLEETRFGGYKVAIDVLALKEEVDFLKRKVAALEESAKKQ